MKQLQLAFFLIIFHTTGFTHVCAQTKVPAWFLTPAPDEYVGVSIPTTSNAEAEASAIMSALFSFAAHNPEPQTEVTKNTHTEATEIQTEGEQSYLRVIKNRNIYPAFDIVRSHTSKSGELFIAIKILDDNSKQDTCSIEYNKTHYISTNNTSSHTEMKMHIICHYTHSGIIPQKILYTYDTSYKEKNGKESFLYKVEAAEKKNSIYSIVKSGEPDKIYTYKNSNTLSKNRLEYIPVGSCKNSLHMAYVQHLFRYIDENSKPTSHLEIFENTLYCQPSSNSL